MVEDELVYALAVRPATPRQQWHARLVCANGGVLAEFDTLAELVHYLAQASLIGSEACRASADAECSPVKRCAADMDCLRCKRGKTTTARGKTPQMQLALRSDGKSVRQTRKRRSRLSLARMRESGLVVCTAEFPIPSQ